MTQEMYVRKPVVTRRNWEQIAIEAIGAVGMSLLAAQIVLHSLVPHISLR